MLFWLWLPSNVKRFSNCAVHLSDKTEIFYRFAYQAFKSPIIFFRTTHTEYLSWFIAHNNIGNFFFSSITPRAFRKQSTLLTVPMRRLDFIKLEDDKISTVRENWHLSFRMIADKVNSNGKKMLQNLNKELNMTKVWTKIVWKICQKQKHKRKTFALTSWNDSQKKETCS